MKNQKHLPLAGVGPVYGAVVIILTVLAAVTEERMTGRVTYFFAFSSLYEQSSAAALTGSVRA